MAAAAAAEPRRFHRLENVTPESVDELFLNRKPPSHYQSETPVFIFLIGAPGVGKTTQIQRVLREEEKLKDISYDHLYKISLDTIVEHTEPYRNATRKLYHEIKKIREEKGEQITNYNYASAMSGIYLTAIQSKNPDFTLGWAMNNAEIQKRAQHTIDAIEAKKAKKAAATNATTLPINSPTRKVTTKATNVTKKRDKQSATTVATNAETVTNVTNKLAKMNLGYTQRSDGRYVCTHCKKDFAGTTHMENRTCYKKKNGGSIKDIADNDIITNAIDMSYNILYDTTMDIKRDKKTDTLRKEDEQLPKIRTIMKLLEKAPHYKIYMIHVTVTHITEGNIRNNSKKKIESSIATIKRRLHTRHQNMITSGYLRAIPSSSTLLKQFIIDNLLGFELMKKLYPNVTYIERENPQVTFAASPAKVPKHSPRGSPRTSKSPKRPSPSTSVSPGKSPRTTHRSPRGASKDAANA